MSPVKVRGFTSAVSFTFSETMDKLDKDGQPTVKFTTLSGVHPGVAAHGQAEITPNFSGSKHDKVIYDALHNISTDLAEMYESLDLEPISDTFTVMSFDGRTQTEGQYKVHTPHLQKDSSGNYISDECLFMNLGPSGAKFFPMGYAETPIPLFIHGTVITPTPKDGIGRTYLLSDGPTKILVQELRNK